MPEGEIAENIAAALGWADVVVVLGAVGVLLVIAYFTGKDEKDTADFFVGSRRVPAIVACLSFVATEISAVTIIAVPAATFSENWMYLQMFIGSAAAKIFVAAFFIPVFYKYNCTTIYEFLKHRFGDGTQYTTSVLFFITRLLAASVRLYVTCLGVHIITGWSLVQSLVLFTIVSVAFIGFGGIKAVIWTGAFSSIVFFLAAIAVGAFLVFNIRGGIAETWQIAGQAGRLDLLNFKLSVSDPMTFGAMVINGFLVGVCVFGTDQEMMQRMLTVESCKKSQRAMLATIVAALPITCVYMALGTLLFVFYQQHSDLPLPAKTDDILPHFAVYSLPMGLKGLILAAIVLASIDSPLSSLSSSFVTDIYRPLIRKGESEKHYLWVSRLGIIAFGLVLAAMAYACRNLDGVLWFAFKIFAATGGSMLGVFLLGIFTRKRRNRTNVVVMIATSIVMTVLFILSEKGDIKIGWTWLIAIGTAATFILSYITPKNLFDRQLSSDVE